VQVGNLGEATSSIPCNNRKSEGSAVRTFYNDCVRLARKMFNPDFDHVRINAFTF